MTIRHDIRDRLQARRKAAGLSHEKLGTLVGVSGKTIGRWESGASEIPVAARFKLARVLQVDPAEFDAADFLELGDERPGWFDEWAKVEAEAMRTIYNVTGHTRDELRAMEARIMAQLTKIYDAMGGAA